MPQNFGPYYQPALTGASTVPEMEEIMSRYTEAAQPSFASGRTVYTPYSGYTPRLAMTSMPTPAPIPAITNQAAITGDLSNPALEGAGGEFGGDFGVSGPAAPFGSDITSGVIGGAISGGIQGGVPGAIMGGIGGAVTGLGQLGGRALTSTLGWSTAPGQHNMLTDIGLTPQMANITKGAITTGLGFANPNLAVIPSAVNFAYNLATGKNVSRDVAAMMLGPLNAIRGVPYIGAFLTGMVAEPMASFINTMFGGQVATQGTRTGTMGTMFSEFDFPENQMTWLGYPLKKGELKSINAPEAGANITGSLSETGLATSPMGQAISSQTAAMIDAMQSEDFGTVGLGPGISTGWGGGGGDSSGGEGGNSPGTGGIGPSPGE